jgi:hypothetical protein
MMPIGSVILESRYRKNPLSRNQKSNKGNNNTKICLIYENMVLLQT